MENNSSLQVSGAQLLADGGSVSGSDYADWLRDAMARHLAGESLAAALGLDRAALVRARDRALAEAADLVCPGGASAWDRAVSLEYAIRRFEGSLWPRIQSGQNFQAVHAPSDEALIRAFRCWRVPKTARHLWDILK